MSDWRPTGRHSFGPGQTLREVAAGRALGFALQLDRAHRDHPALRGPPALVPFLRDGGVDGIAPLVRFDPEHGRWLLHTGPAWPVSELFRVLARPGAPPRQPAALELMAGLAGVLHEAAAAAAAFDVYAHGAVAPWRTAVRSDGVVLVLGYGIPPLSALSDGKPEADAFRYAPPERFTDAPEDVRSDLFSVGLLGFELATGLPLYTGDTERVRAAAERGTARQRLHRMRHRVSPQVYEILDRCFALYPDARWPDGPSLRHACLDLAGSPHAIGTDLADLMGWVAAHDAEGPRRPREAPPAPRERPRQARDTPRWAKVRRTPAPAQPRAAAPDRPARPTRRVPRRRGTLADHNSLYPVDPVGGRGERYRIRTADGSVHRVPLSPHETLAKSAARVIDALEFSPVDLTGRIRGWYRLVQGDGAWFGDAPTSVLDAEAEVELEFLRNADVDVEVHVPEHEPWAVTVGTAVHAQFLIGEIRRVLALPGSHWRLHVGGDPLDQWQVLDDFDPVDGMVVEVVGGR